MKVGPLYPYQERVRKFAASRFKVGFFVFYGGGKTYNSLQWLADRIVQGFPTIPCLVIVKKRLIPQWCNEIKKFTNFTAMPVVGTSKERVQCLRRPANIYVINYDAVRNKQFCNAIAAKNFMALIVDESTKLKTSETKRFEKLYKLLKYVGHKALLTGRAIEEKPEDVFAQMLFMDNGTTFGKAFWGFRYTYFNQPMPQEPYKWRLKHGANKLIAAKLSKSCIRVRKAEILDQLPPQVFNPVYFELPSKVRAIYKKVKKEFAATLPSGHNFETQWAVVRSQKLHQIAAGFFYKEGAKEYDILHNIKTAWIEENVPLMRDEGQVLLWSNFTLGLRMMYAALMETKLKVSIYDGSLKLRESAKMERDFQDGKIDVMIISQKAGCEGLNLPQACHAASLSMGYEAGQNANKNDRCHRIGSEIHSQVTYWPLLMKDTVDEVVYKAIQTKTSIADSILNHIREV